MANINMTLGYRIDMKPEEYAVMIAALRGKPLSDEQKKTAANLVAELDKKRKANAENILGTLN